MKARKHRYTQQAKETERLEPKGKQTGSGPPEWPDADQSAAGVQSRNRPAAPSYGEWCGCGKMAG
jgi:hypothetical protein